MAILREIDDVKRVLREAKTIAVLGAHSNPSKAAHYVPRYLEQEGYQIYPVNPVYAGEVLFGKPVQAHLTDIDMAVDVVDVFRRSEHLEGHLEEILSMKPLPKVVWLQQGIKNEVFAQKLSDAGIEVIQDRCMLADHQHLL